MCFALKTLAVIVVLGLLILAAQLTTDDSMRPRPPWRR